jgi:hypothetical protein
VSPPGDSNGGRGQLVVVPGDSSVGSDIWSGDGEREV